MSSRRKSNWFRRTFFGDSLVVSTGESNPRSTSTYIDPSLSSSLSGLDQLLIPSDSDIRVKGAFKLSPSDVSVASCF